MQMLQFAKTQHFLKVLNCWLDYFFTYYFFLQLGQTLTFTEGCELLC